MVIVSFRGAWSSAAIVAWAGLSAVPAQGAEVFRGQLYCKSSKGLAALADIVDFSVTVDGTQVSYHRDPIGRIAPEVDLVESGTGTLSGDRLEMSGGAATEDWQLSSSYRGRRSGDRVTLQGEQVWRGTTLPAPVSRTCDAILTR